MLGKRHKYSQANIIQEKTLKYNTNRMRKRRYKQKKSYQERKYRVRWGNLGQKGYLGHFRFSLSGTSSMDCISPLTSEMSAAVPSDFCPWMVREGRGISTDINEFFLLKLNFLKK